MKHRSLDEIRTEAKVAHAATLTKREKLDRWAKILSDLDGKLLATLPSVEYMAKADRLELRRDNSAISVAFADPILRGAGLRDDTYGGALAFFELSHSELHRLTCRCHFGQNAPADRVARRVSGVSSSFAVRAGQVWSRLTTAFAR